jgi:thioredoxin-related protein
MDCEVTNCAKYNIDCFFKTILVRKPDPKTGCSYCRKLKKQEKNVDEQENDITKTQVDKRQKKEKKEKKRKKEENSLQEII